MRLSLCVALCLCFLEVYCQQFTPPQLTPGTGTPTGGGVTGTGPRPGVFQNPVRTPIAGTGFGRPMGPMFGRFGPPFSPPLTPMSMMMASLARNPNNYRYATCVFNDTFSTVKGRADFRQFLIGEGRQQVQVRIQLSGLPMAASEAERGLHIHEFGDTGDGCSRVGPHFNPNQTPHGSQRNFAYLRHVGDLGNIRQSTDGLVSTQFVDQVISLEGMSNVVGRSMVLKLERDDLGLGNNRESQVNGNTYTPIGCCVIGRTTAHNWYNPLTAEDIQNMAATGLMPDHRIDPYSNTGGTGMPVPGVPVTPGTGFVPGTGFPPGTGFVPGTPGTGFVPGTPGTGFVPGTPGTGFVPGTPGTGFVPGTPGTGFVPGTPGTPGTGFVPGTPGTGFVPGTPGTGFVPGTPGTGFVPGTPGTGFVPGRPGSGFVPGQPGVAGQPGTGQPGFGSPGFGTGFGSTTFGAQPGVTGFSGQPGFGGASFTGTGSQTGQGFTGSGGLTQPGASNGGLTQPGFNPAGTGAQPGTSGSIGTGAFTPGATQGQTFNFNQQG